MSGELKSTFISVCFFSFPITLLCLRPRHRAGRHCMWTLTQLSPTSLPSASFPSVRSHASPFFVFDLICLICVGFPSLPFLPSLPLPPPVSPFYIYMRVLGHTVAFIHVCSSLHNPTSFPCTIFPCLPLSLSRFSSVFPSGSLALCLWLISCRFFNYTRLFCLYFWFVRRQGIAFASTIPARGQSGSLAHTLEVDCAVDYDLRS